MRVAEAPPDHGRRGLVNLGGHGQLRGLSPLELCSPGRRRTTTLRVATLNGANT